MVDVPLLADRRRGWPLLLTTTFCGPPIDIRPARCACAVLVCPPWQPIRRRGSDYAPACPSASCRAPHAGRCRPRGRAGRRLGARPARSDDAPADNWDAATSAIPEQVVALFPGATWENRFGTVTVGANPAVEITSYRAEGTYADRRRPTEVRFGVSLDEDLARRDFTINAMAWLPIDLASAARPAGRPLRRPGGSRRSVLRAVGEPRERFAEDALRLDPCGAIRRALRADASIPPPRPRSSSWRRPWRACRQERIRDELLRMLSLDPTLRPARSRLLERLGPAGGDPARADRPARRAAVEGDARRRARPHACAPSTRAARAGAGLRLAALLHDLGKATTLRDGHFIGHERVGAELGGGRPAAAARARALADAVVGAIRNHMYDYDPSWTDAAVRRFIRRLDGVDRELLFALRRADNAPPGSGRRRREPGRARGADRASRLEAEPGLLVSSPAGDRRPRPPARAGHGARAGDRRDPRPTDRDASSTIPPERRATSCSTWRSPAVTLRTAEGREPDAVRQTPNGHAATIGRPRPVSFRSSSSTAALTGGIVLR